MLVFYIKVSFKKPYKYGKLFDVYVIILTLHPQLLKRINSLYIINNGSEENSWTDGLDFYPSKKN